MRQRNTSRNITRQANEGRYVIFNENVSSLFLFVFCLGLACTILLADRVSVKLVQFLFFFIIVLLTKRQRHLVGTALVFLSTVLFNLAAGEGKVLVHVFGQPITLGAVQTGVSRGLTIVTLFYMSKAMIGPAPYFRGRLGSFLGRIFAYFDFFSNGLQTVKLKSLWADIDRLLVAAESRARCPGAARAARAPSPGTYFLYAGVLFGNIILLILNYVFFH